MFARDRELKKVDKLMEEFDKELYDLWKEMVQIEYKLKNGDLRLITRWARGSVIAHGWGDRCILSQFLTRNVLGRTAKE